MPQRKAGYRNSRRMVQSKKRGKNNQLKKECQVRGQFQKWVQGLTRNGADEEEEYLKGSVGPEKR